MNAEKRSWPTAGFARTAPKSHHHRIPRARCKNLNHTFARLDPGSAMPALSYLIIASFCDIELMGYSMGWFAFWDIEHMRYPASVILSSWDIQWGGSPSGSPSVQLGLKIVRGSDQSGRGRNVVPNGGLKWDGPNVRLFDDAATRDVRARGSGPAVVKIRPPAGWGAV